MRYIVVASALPPRAMHPEGKHSQAKDREAELIGDYNVLKICLDPNRDGRETREGDQAFYKIFVNSLGSLYNARLNPGQAPDKGWNAEHLPNLQTECDRLDNNLKDGKERRSCINRMLRQNPKDEAHQKCAEVLTKQITEAEAKLPEAKRALEHADETQPKILFDAKTQARTQPLEGYGVRIIRLK